MYMEKQQVKSYYKNLAVQYEMFRYCRNREFMAICINNPKRTTRNLKLGNVQSFQYFQKNLFHDDTFNFYYSLAEFKKPLDNVLSRVGTQDRKKAVDEWKKNFWKEIKGFDILIDIDIPSNTYLSYAYETAKAVKKLLDISECPYSLRYSGKGFHLIIPHPAIKKSFCYNPENPTFVMFYRKLLRAFKVKCGDLVDTKIGDIRRVVKIPYSLACYQKNRAYMCFPFISDDEFKKFDKLMTSPNYWYSLIYNKIFKRGSHTFNEKGNADKLLKNLECFA